MALDVEREHSSGAFAERYVARDRASGEEVLVSIVRARFADLDEEGRRRLLEAVRRYRGLVHPHICAPIDAGFTPGGQLWISQELPGSANEGEGAGGEELAGAETLTHICEGMAYAHARGLVHGALTRDAILLERSGTPKIADFGVGAVLHEAGLLAAMAEETRAASPEITAGGEPSTQSDVYDLGAIGLALVWPAGESGALAGPQTLADRAHGIPSAGLAGALERALQPDPRARFQSAEELLQQLRSVVVPRASARPRKARPLRRPKEPEPVEPEMSWWKAIGLLLWTLGRSMLSLLLGLALLAAAVTGGLVLAFQQTPAEVHVRDVEGRSAAQAMALLEAQGLKGRVVRQAYNPDVAAGDVVSQSPYPGKRVRAGRTVELVVSKGPPRVKVPELTGKSLDEAKGLLGEAGLQMGAISRRRSEEPPNQVLAQSPPPGKVVSVKSEVNVQISEGKEQPSERQSERGPRAGDVSITVPEGPVVQRVRVEVHYPSDRYSVAYNRVHRPGDKVKVHVVAEGRATIQTFLDGDLVREEELPPPPSRDSP